MAGVDAGRKRGAAPPARGRAHSGNCGTAPMLRDGGGGSGGVP